MRAIERMMDRMNGTAFGLVAAAFLAVGCTPGESSDAPGEEPNSGEETRAPAPAPVRAVPVGTSMTFTVDETISTATNGVGDTFTATLGSGVIGTDGTALVPAGAKSRWIVTEAKKSGSESAEALLAFRLESVEVNGRWLPVQATVTNADLEASAQDSGGETAAKVAVGTAAGAIIGQILGKNTESTLKGAGVGAVVGTVVALTTRGGNAAIQRGSTVTVRLDERLVVS